jgi:hypothetical protein
VTDQKRKVLMAYISISKVVLEGFSQKGNFDGLYKQLKNAFGIEFPFWENLMADISRSCD